MHRQSGKSFHRALPFVILAALVLISYIGTLKAEFVYDDHTQLAENVALRSLRNIPLFFTDPARTSGSMIFEEIYRPLRSTVFAVEYQLWGLNPSGFHAVNVLFHLLNTFLVFLFLKRIVRAPRAAFGAALLFAAHPALTEDVCWICSRSDLLCMFFYLVGLLCYFRSREETGPKRAALFGISLVAMTFSLLSKEMGVTFPLALVAIDLWQEGFKRQRPRRWMEYAPFVIVTAGYLIFRANIMSQFAQRAPWGDTLAATAGIMSRGIAYYIRLLVLPVNLTVVPRIILDMPVLSTQNILAIALVVSLIGFAFIFRRRYPVASLGIVVFFILLLPVSNIVPIKAVVGDRFVYIPSLGFFVVWAALFRVFEAPSSRPSAALRAFSAGAIAIVVFLYSVNTVVRSLDWRDGFALYSSAVEVAPNNPRPRVMLGKEYFLRGDYEATREQCLIALRRNPMSADAHTLLGTVFIKEGLLRQAEREFKVALELDPASGDANNNLGLVYKEQGKLDEALARFKAALKNNPVVSEILNNVGSVLLEKQEFAEAYEYVDKAFKIKPDNWEAACNLAYVLIKLHRPAEAIEVIEYSLSRHPADPELLMLLGQAYEEEGNFVAAARAYKLAVSAAPTDTRAPLYLAKLYMRSEQYKEAEQIYRDMLAKYPTAANLHASLASALEKQGLLDAAAEELRLAARLNPGDADVHRKLGELLEKAGRLADAREEYSLAEQLTNRASD